MAYTATMPDVEPKSQGPKKQHYVPQFMLRNFADAEERVFIFDKQTGKVRRQVVREVGHENRTYEVKTDEGQVVSLEGRLARLENECAPVLRNLADGNMNIGQLSEQDRFLIAMFAAVQMLRVPHARNSMLATNELLLAQLTARFGRDRIGKDILDQLESFDKDAAKKVSLVSIVNDAPEFAKLIHDKRWVLQTATGAASFFISDNPISRLNHVPRPHRGNLGLKCDGIEIYLPLSPCVTLAFLDPLLVDLMTVAESEAGRRQEALDWSNGRASMTDGNVVHLNSLQVIEAERFIFSQTDDFDLVREMMQSHPELKVGPRARIM